MTQAGERLLPYALEILNSVEKAENIAQEPDQISGTLRIGTCESYVISILPPVVMEFSELCPRVEISTHTCLLYTSDAADEKFYFPEWVKVSEKPQKISFIASADSPLADQKQIPLEQLLKEPLCLTERGISYRYAVEQLLAAKGYELHPFWEVGNTDVITEFLLKNKAISFLPEYVVSDYIENGKLTILDTECDEITMWGQLVYHKNKCVTPQMNLFLELLLKHIGK